MRRRHTIKREWINWINHSDTWVRSFSHGSYAWELLSHSSSKSVSSSNIILLELDSQRSSSSWKTCILKRCLKIVIIIREATERRIIIINSPWILTATLDYSLSFLHWASPQSGILTQASLDGKTSRRDEKKETRDQSQEMSVCVSHIFGDQRVISRWGCMSSSSSSLSWRYRSPWRKTNAFSIMRVLSITQLTQFRFFSWNSVRNSDQDPHAKRVKSMRRGKA